MRGAPRRGNLVRGMLTTEVCEPKAFKAQIACKLITGLPRHFVSRNDEKKKQVGARRNPESSGVAAWLEILKKYASLRGASRRGNLVRGMLTTEVCEPKALKAQIACKLITGLPRHFVFRNDEKKKQVGARRNPESSGVAAWLEILKKYASLRGAPRRGNLVRGMLTTEVCEPKALKAQIACKLITGLPRHCVSRNDEK